MNKSIASLLALGAFTVFASQSHADICDTTNLRAWPSGNDVQELSCADGTRGRGVADNSGPRVLASLFDFNNNNAEVRVFGSDNGDLVCQAFATAAQQDEDDNCDRQPTNWGATLDDGT